MCAASYNLVKSHFLNGEDKYHARVQHTETVYMDDIIDLMAYHGSTVTRADIHAVKEDMLNAIVLAVLMGKRVVTPFGIYSLSVKGTFDSLEDTLDSVRHQVLAAVSASSEIKDAIDNKVSLSKQRSGVRRPSPMNLKNFHKAAGEGELTPSHAARIYGDLLRFDPEDPEQGIFLHPVGEEGQLNGAEPVRMEEVIRSTPSEATFLVPADLSPGDYILEVRTRFNQKNLRTGQLEQILTVPAL